MTPVGPGTTPSGAMPTAGGGIESWAGRTFLLHIPQENWAYPRDIGTEIGPFVPDFLIGVDTAATGAMSLTVTTANAAGAQEPCSPTTTVTGSSAGFPASQIGPASVPIHIKHVTEPGLQVNATIRNFTLTDVLPGAEAASGGGLVTSLDVRDLYPMFTQIDENPDTEMVCNALASFGSPCEACPHDGAMYCLEVEAVELGATEHATPITPVAAVTDPACAGANEL